MVKSMRPGRGRMAVVLPQGVLFRGGAEGQIRQKLVQTGFVEAVVTLGDKIFYGTGLSPCFLVLRWVKPHGRERKTIMIDGSKILTKQRAQNVLSDDDVDRLYQLYSDYKDVEDYSRVVDVSEIAAKGYDLSVNKYVKYHEEAVKVVSEKFRALLAKGGYLK